MRFIAVDRYISMTTSMRITVTLVHSPPLALGNTNVRASATGRRRGCCGACVSPSNIACTRRRRAANSDAPRVMRCR